MATEEALKKMDTLYNRLLGESSSPDLIEACATWTLRFGDLLDVFNDAEGDEEFGDRSIDAWIALLEHVSIAPFNTKAGTMYQRLRARAGNQRRELRRLNKKYNCGTQIEIHLRQNEEIRKLKGVIKYLESKMDPEELLLHHQEHYHSMAKKGEAISRTN
jgi:hypothetical protein